MATQVAEPRTGERRLTMTYEEFLAFADEDLHAEWVDGEVTIFMSASGIHQLVAGLLHALLLWFVGERGAGQVLDAPFEMVLLVVGRSREPDVLFVAKVNEHRLTPMRLRGPADLVVEVVSDESETRDLVDKLHDYQAEGIPEYVWIDPRPGHQRAGFLRLDERGVYREVPLDDLGRFRSSVLEGFWIDPSWFWQDPLPTLGHLISLFGHD